MFAPVEATDLLSYLVLDTSYYTKTQFKAFRSLQAYNHMVSGFMTSVQGKVVNGKRFVVIVLFDKRFVCSFHEWH